MRLVVALVGAVLTLTACGSGGSTSAGGTGASSTPTGSSSASAGSPSAGPAKPVSSAELRKQLMTIDDLPPGYSADKLTSADSSLKAKHYFCDYKAAPAQSAALQSFTNEQGLASSVFQTGIRRFSSAAQAAGQMKLLKKTMQTCDGETYQGDKLTYAVISAPAIGSDRIGIRVKFNEGTVTDYFILNGPDMVQVAMGGTALSGQTISGLTDLATKQMAKVKSG